MMSTHFTPNGYSCVKDAPGFGARKETASAFSVFAAKHDARRERVGDSLQLAKLRIRKVRAGIGRCLALARHLQHADHAVGEGNRGAFRGRFSRPTPLCSSTESALLFGGSPAPEIAERARRT